MQFFRKHHAEENARVQRHVAPDAVKQIFAEGELRQQINRAHDVVDAEFSVAGQLNVAHLVIADVKKFVGRIEIVLDKLIPNGGGVFAQARFAGNQQLVVTFNAALFEQPFNVAGLQVHIGQQPNFFVEPNAFVKPTDDFFARQDKRNFGCNFNFANVFAGLRVQIRQFGEHVINFVKCHVAVFALTGKFFRLNTERGEVNFATEQVLNLEADNFVDVIRFGDVAHQQRVEDVERQNFRTGHDQSPRLNVRACEVLPKIFAAEVNRIFFRRGIEFVILHAFGTRRKQNTALEGVRNRAVVLTAFGREVLERQTRVQNFAQSPCACPKHCTRGEVEVVGNVRLNFRTSQKLSPDFAIGQPGKRRIRHVVGRSRINHADKCVIRKRLENLADTRRRTQQRVEQIISPVELLLARVQ